jgi:phosphoglycolate phosphatase-like HAD superfamily hydrolase
MYLAIFDVDGTLTKTNHVDDLCFVRAFADEFAITGINTDWSDYPDVTDSGITRQIFLDRCGRLPTTDELSRLQNCFVRLLQESFGQTPQLFVEIPGASIALKKLLREPDWAVAIATGGWRASALLKLQKVQIDIEGIPAAFADDGITREEVIKRAIGRAQNLYRQECFDQVIYIGDAVWDVRTARQLGFAFLGVGSSERETALRAEGATAIICDFTDFDRFLRMLRELVYGKGMVR